MNINTMAGAHTASRSDGRGANTAPVNFNPATHPILARHFFGVGPLRPIGQILPAVLADLARTIAANTNSPQNTRNQT